MAPTVRNRIAFLSIISALVFAVCGLIAASPARAAADTIRVTVTYEGQPVPGVDVVVSGTSGDSSGTTDAAGRIELEVSGTGLYTIAVDPATLPEGVPAPSAPLEFNKISSGSSFVVLKLGEDATTGSSASSPSSSASSASASPTPGGTDTSGTGNGEATTQDTGSFGHQLATKVVRGVIFGLRLALAAIGVSLIYGMTGLNNVAHGELVSFGGFVAYVAMTSSAGMNGWAAMLLALMAGAGFGWLQNATIWHPLRKKCVGLIQIMIVSIGLSLLLRYIYAFIFGPNRLVMPQSFDAVATPFGVPVSYWGLWGSVLCLVLLAAVVLILERTRLGKSIRAVADNKMLAATAGIAVERVILMVWMGGAALAAVSGVLVAFYQTLSFQGGAQILLLIFAAVTLGGLGSAYGALVGALILSLFVELSTFIIPTSMKNVAAMIVMIAILLIRPSGILGKAQRVG